MARCDKLLERARNSPKNLRFSELCQLAECYGFVFDRQEGSHCMYKRPGWPRLMNVQDNHGKAIPYQVKQLLDAIDVIRGESMLDKEQTDE